jgi:hypothetical protein
MGIIAIQWWDRESERNRLAVGYPGENGIKPGTAYSLDDEGNFVEVANADRSAGKEAGSAARRGESGKP